MNALKAGGIAIGYLLLFITGSIILKWDAVATTNVVGAVLLYFILLGVKEDE